MRHALRLLTLVLGVCLIAGLVMPAIAGAALETNYVARYHGADSVWGGTGPHGYWMNVQAFVGTQIGRNSDIGYKFGWHTNGLVVQAQEQDYDNGYLSYMIGTVDHLDGGLDKGLTGASVDTPVEMTGQEWVGPTWDENGQLPPTRTWTEKLNVHVDWVGIGDITTWKVGDRLPTPWYVQADHVHGQTRQATAYCRITREDGSVFWEGPADWAGFNDLFQSEKLIEPGLHLQSF